MSLYGEINRKPSRRDLRSFGLIVLVGFSALGAFFQLRSHQPTLALGAFGVGAAVFLLSFIPAVGRLLYVGWMGLGLTIGLLTSPIIMGVVFVLVIVPIALVMKLTRRDLMRRKLDPKAETYWEDYPSSDDPGSYVRQF